MLIYSAPLIVDFIASITPTAEMVEWEETRMDTKKT